jgi:hypothetical protein
VVQKVFGEFRFVTDVFVFAESDGKSLPVCPTIGTFQFVDTRFFVFVLLGMDTCGT